MRENCDASYLIQSLVTKQVHQLLVKHIKFGQSIERVGNLLCTKLFSLNSALIFNGKRRKEKEKQLSQAPRFGAA